MTIKDKITILANELSNSKNKAQQLRNYKENMNWIKSNKDLINKALEERAWGLGTAILYSNDSPDSKSNLKLKQTIDKYQNLIKLFENI